MAKKRASTSRKLPATDADRLLWLIRDTGIDAFGEHDLHELAWQEADKHGREEANDSDYLVGIRKAIDAVRAA
jgi:hypothetical protein